MSTNNDQPRQSAEAFGYRGALAEVTAELAALNARRLDAERAARRARWERRPVLLDERGLALAA